MGTAVLVSLLCLTFIIGTQILLYRARQARLRTFELVPNCLLTRHTLVFISGRRSVFNFMSYWNLIPEFLREHGYPVIVLNLPWRGQKKREAYLMRFLKALESPCHFIGDSTLESELKFLGECRHPMVSSINLVGLEDFRKKDPLATSDLHPDRVLRFELGREVFERRFSIPDFAHSLLISFHNLLNFPGPRVKRSEVGAQASSWSVEKKFLELAVQLAERDLLTSGLSSSLSSGRVSS